MSNYFHEDQIYALWHKKYKEERNLTIIEEHEFWKQIDLLINGVIWTHAYVRFEPYDDCKSIAFEAILKALPRYDVDKILKSGKKPSLFNYLSLVAKRSILFFTLKNKQKREQHSYDQQVENGFDYKTYRYIYTYNKKSFINDINKMIRKSPYFRSKEYLYEIADIFYDYISDDYTVKTKREMLRHFYTYNITPHQCRVFNKMITENNKEVYEIFNKIKV